MTEKKKMNTVVITRDGWVYVLAGGKEIGLGDINVDCQIVDLRRRLEKMNESRKRAKALIAAGVTYVDIASEVGVSRPTLYKWFGNVKKRV